MRCVTTLLTLALGLSAIPAAAQQARQEPPNPFLGSIAGGTVTTEPLRLSVKDAVDRALHSNLGLLVEEETAATAARLAGALWRISCPTYPAASAHAGRSSTSKHSDFPPSHRLSDRSTRMTRGSFSRSRSSTSRR